MPSHITPYDVTEQSQAYSISGDPTYLQKELKYKSIFTDSCRKGVEIRFWNFKEDSTPQGDQTLVHCMIGGILPTLYTTTLH